MRWPIRCTQTLAGQTFSSRAAASAGDSPASTLPPKPLYLGVRAPINYLGIFMQGSTGLQVGTETTLLVSEENLYQCEFEYTKRVKVRAMINLPRWTRGEDERICVQPR